MSERTAIAVVSDLIKSGLTVEQQILVNELIIVGADLQREAAYKRGVEDGMEMEKRERRAIDAERKRIAREPVQDVQDIQDVQDKKERSPTPPKEKIYIKNNPPPPLETDQGFAEWYLVYPRREARRAAAKAYRHALKRGATPENLLAGAKRYAGECSGRDRQYIALPATWLNADRWLDEQGKVVSFVSPPKRSWAEIKAERMREQGNETGG